LHLLNQRIENYALFPEVSLQNPVARLGGKQRLPTRRARSGR